MDAELVDAALPTALHAAERAEDARVAQLPVTAPQRDAAVRPDVVVRADAAGEAERLEPRARRTRLLAAVAAQAVDGLAPFRPGVAAASRASGTGAFRFPPNGSATFTRRNNTNYMETGVLSALQLTSMFPNLVLENFYVKTRNSIEAGKTQAPFGYVIPVQRDMTRVVTLVNILRAQGIEIGAARRLTSRSARTRTRRARTSSSSTSRTAGSPRTCSSGRTIRTPR